MRLAQISGEGPQVRLGGERVVAALGGAHLRRDGGSEPVGQFGGASEMSGV
jgi:hypothetical protein